MPRIDGSNVNLTAASLSTVGHKRKLRYCALGTCIFSVIFTYNLMTASRSYTAATSLSLAQQKGSGGLLASMAGIGGGAGSKYIGILRSWRFAEMAEERVHLQALYKLPTRNAAVGIIQSSISVNDSMRDGLLYISVTLKGPPYLALHTGKLRGKIKETAVQIANVYADLLRDYVTTSDMDSGSILLQEADGQIKKAHVDYALAVADLGSFVRRHGVYTPPMGSASSTIAGTTSNVDSSAVASAGTSAKVLETLYSTRATLEAETQSALAATQAGNHLRTDQLTNLGDLPTEDPLLMAARASVSRARNEVRALEKEYGPEHPQVMLAQDRLHLAEADLSKQVGALRMGRTTKSVEAAIQLKALQARYEVTNHQIARAEQSANIGREYLTEFDMRRNELMLRLEVLKTTASQAAILSMQVVSAQNRIRVVDVAREAGGGAPSLMTLGGMSLALSLLALLPLWHRGSLLRLRNRMDADHAVTTSSAPSENSASIEIEEEQAA